MDFCGGVCYTGGMAKKRTPEQEAVRKAMKKPERRWFMSRLHAFGPFFWTNYNEVSICWGEPKNRFHGEQVPEHNWTIWFRLWTPRLMVWKHLRRIV
jgi:hypothetical protein